MELACGLPPGPNFAEQAVVAESLGYSRVWVFGSAPLWEDPFVHLALAATRTSSIGLATAVLVPTERSVMSMATSIAAIARLSGGRFRAGFGTGYTARYCIGQRAMTVAAMGRYLRQLRGLLDGEVVEVDDRPVQMLHAPGLTAERPIDVELWLSALGPRTAALAAETADGVLGPVHASLPSAIIQSGTVLAPAEDERSERVLEAVGPWRVGSWHTAYAAGGADRVDAKPGGEQWRRSLEAGVAERERHLHTFVGHETHMNDRDRALLPHIDTATFVGSEDVVARAIRGLADAGFRELIYTPSGPDVGRELRAFAGAHRLAAT